MLSRSQKHWPLDTEYFETDHTNFEVGEVSRRRRPVASLSGLVYDRASLSA